MAAATLAQELESESVDFDQLHRDYKPVLGLVRELIGFVPNCDPYLEIWPIGFRTYSLLVPNLLNLPASLIGQGAPKDLVGLGMYTASRAAGCMYCSAHTCTFALRRGASPEAVTGEAHTPAEAAVVSLAHALGQVPATLTQAQVHDLEEHLDPGDAEWIVLAVALMGFLNKFMDTMGIELEVEAIADVQDLIGPTGWSTGKHQWKDELDIPPNGHVPKDSMSTYLRVFRQAPGALRLEGRWTRGVSGRIGSALMMLEDQIGHSFPIFASLKHKRSVKALATVLRDNLNEEHTTVGLPAKCMVALVYARVVDNEALTAEAVQLADILAPDLDPDIMVGVGHYALAPGEEAVIPGGLSRTEAAAIILAKAASTSPSSVNEITVSTVTDHLDAEQIVEVVVWIAVLQMLHRLYAYYDARLGLT
ncbi:MAG: hypothetical protein OEV40_06800 [Acidimicrobiia bacterium]|nr:hypothetical protein [Acidimicrobiia bacterium]